jgi:DNA polymerase-3 subunit alpha
VQEFTEDELVALERQLLGYSLSAKPISEIIGGLEFESTHKISEIMGSEEQLGNVKVAAVVTSVRKITTKKGTEMAFLKLDDGTGTIEVVVFPRIYSESKDLLVDGKPLLISGKVDVRDETPGIIVDSIETPKMGERPGKDTVRINIPGGADINNLQRLKTLLTENLGDKEAYLIFEGGKEVKLPFKIAWDESISLKISEILEK